MNNKLLSAFTIGSTILLMACSGGGKSDNSSTPMLIGGTTNTGSTTATTNTSSTKIDTSIQGNIITLNPANDRVAKTNTQTLSTTEINKVVVDGKTIHFTPGSGLSGNLINLQSNSSVRVGGANLSYTRYGYVKEGANSTPYVFAQGKVTTDNMPTTGTAQYKGNATHVENGAISLATAQFNVDYRNKTLTGTIKPSSGTEIVLDANITGNRFQSTGQGVGRMITNGYFYGANAEELGGTYQNMNGNINGAFGAKK